MSSALKNLFYLEFLSQVRKHNITKFLICFFVTFIIVTYLINYDINSKKIALVFSIIFFPLSLMGFANIILKPDLEDGSLEELLTCFRPFELILVKFLVYLSASLISLIVIIPILLIFFQIESLSYISKITFCFILLLILTNALILLIGALQCYFRSNINFLSSCILFLILPSLIIAAAALENKETWHILNLLLGIDLILVPILLILASYLIKNVYHMDD